jgi:conjugative relaxase-like TrwC/TraI family protein
MTVSCKKGRASGGAYYINASEQSESAEMRQGSVDDYYTNSKEPPGVWYAGIQKNTSARENSIGIEDGKMFSEKDPERFSRLITGFHPDTQKALVQNAGSDPSRLAFFDFTTSAPKSVSVVWSQAEKELKDKIEAAQLNASRKFLDVLSDKAYSRQGKGGVIKTDVPLVAAQFSHGSSRENDPQLHTHNTIFNVSERPDKTTGAIETKQIMSWQGAAASIYHADLAYSLKKAGFEIEKKDKLFEIKGVPDEVTSHFSKRRAQIVGAVEKEFLKMGISPEDAKDYRGLFQKAAIETRDEKSELSRSQLQEIWKKAGQELGFTEKEVKELADKNPERDLTKEERMEVASQAVKNITETEAVFTEPKLLTEIAIELTGKASAEEIMQTFEDVKKELLVATKVDENSLESSQYLTTKEMFKVEVELIESAKDMDQNFSHVLKDVELKKSLSDEQREAVLDATSKGALSVIEGAPGAGKTVTVSAISSAYEKEGYTSFALSTGWNQALKLQEESGIKEARSIAKLLSEVKNEKITPNEKTLFVVDEAGMTGSRDMNELLKIAKQAGSKVVLLGDSKQQGPVAAGQPLIHISNEIGSSKLDIIRRQHDVKERQAVKEFISGNAKQGLTTYQEKGRIHVLSSREDVHKKMVSDWQSNRIQNPEKTSLLIATKNVDVLELNKLARDERKKHGELGEAKQLSTMDCDQKKGETMEFCINDRIQFRNTRMDSEFYVANRHQGVIEKFAEDEIHVRMDDGRLTKINVNDEKWQHKTEGGLAIQHGYCSTTYSSQGQTVDRVYFADSVGLNRASAGVGMSRHREQCDIYVDKQARYEAKMKTMHSDDWHPKEAFSDKECIARMGTSWSKAIDDKSTLSFKDWKSCETGVQVKPEVEAAILRLENSVEIAKMEINRIRESSKIANLKPGKEFPFQKDSSYVLDVKTPSAKVLTDGVKEMKEKYSITDDVLAKAMKQGVLNFSEDGKALYAAKRGDGEIVNQFNDESKKYINEVALRDKFTPVLHGDPNRIDVVKSGKEALALWSIQQREKIEQSTIIINSSGRNEDLRSHFQLIEKSKEVVLHKDDSGILERARESAEREAVERRAQLEAQEREELALRR